MTKLVECMNFPMIYLICIYWLNDVFKCNKVFTCDVCGKLLKSKQNLKYHVKTHTDEIRMSVWKRVTNIKKWFTTPKNYTLWNCVLCFQVVICIKIYFPLLGISKWETIKIWFPTVGICSILLSHFEGF